MIIFNQQIHELSFVVVIEAKVVRKRQHESGRIGKKKTRMKWRGQLKKQKLIPAGWIRQVRGDW